MKMATTFDSELTLHHSVIIEKYYIISYAQCIPLNISLELCIVGRLAICLRLFCFQHMVLDVIVHVINLLQM